MFGRSGDRSRGFAALPAVAVLSGVVLTIGMGVSGRVAALRPAAGVVRRERLVELAVQSALEEVCAGIETHQRNRRTAPPPADAAPTADLPASLDLPATRACYAAEQLVVKPATLAWSDVRREPGPASPLYGITEIVVTITVPHPLRSTTHTAVTRRYFVFKPGSPRGEIRLLRSNIVKLVTRT